MPEITLNGVNALTYPTLTTWNWEVAAYLFLGGLVAGLMVLSSAARLVRGAQQPQRFARALLVSDLAGLPLLGAGMFLLWLDLANRWNVWRFYTTVQWTSVMSWGSWILLATMALLALRLAASFAKLGTRIQWRRLHRVWTLLERIAGVTARWDRWLALATLLLGLGVGIYTGMLLSTIAARPLWNSAWLPFLFLTSGVAGGAAFLMLFLQRAEQERLLPLTLALGVLEALLIGAYVASLWLGTQAMQRASGLLFAGATGWWFWGGVVLVGLLVPLLLETLEWRHKLPAVLTPGAPPLLTLAGGAALRFVIVSAGLLSFI